MYYAIGSLYFFMIILMTYLYLISIL